jgi:hypothetical protein
MGQGFSEREDKRLAGEIGGHQRPGHIRGNRGEIDHAPPPPGQHAGQTQAGELRQGKDVDVEEPILLVGVSIGEGALRAESGAVDQQIDRHLAVAHGLEHFAGGAIPAQIGGDHLDADGAIGAEGAGGLAQHRLTPGDEDQVVIALGQKPGHGLANAGGCAGHQRRLPGRGRIGWQVAGIAHVLSVTGFNPRFRRE